jgi:DNA polymerase III gamma/tau subunit
MNLYTKYRPKNLGEIFGNSLVVMALQQAFKKDAVPTTMMLCGPTGCGKTTLARIIKEELGCSDNNFNELNMSNTRGIDTIRDVIQFSQYQTFDGGVKIFLFDV